MEFQPIQTQLGSTFWLAFVLMLLAGGITAWLLSGKHSLKGNMWRQVVPLWTFIVALLALGVVLFSFWEYKKIGPVYLDAEGIETSYGKARYSEIARIYIHREIDRSLINPNMGRDTTKWLILEERGGKQHALSEDQYDLPAIMESLEIFLEENRNNGK
jgi:hypothetical protein